MKYVALKMGLWRVTCTCEETFESVWPPNFLRSGPFPSYLVPLFQNEYACKTYVWFSARTAFDTEAKIGNSLFKLASQFGQAYPTQAFSQMGVQESCGCPLIEENHFLFLMLP